MTDATVIVEITVLMGVAVVVPLALEDPWWRWLPVAAAIGLSFVSPMGAVAGLSAAVYPIAALVFGARRLIDLQRPIGHQWVPIAALGYAVAAGGALVCSRLGWSLFGTREPIVLLTAVHFTYAGVGATMLAMRARLGAGRRLRPLATLGLVLVVGAPPVVALGFATRWSLPQVGGAVLLTAGVWAIAFVQLAAARRQGPTIGRALLVVSSLAVLAAMPLAVAWAAAQHWGTVPAMSVSDLVRTHGLLNGILFVPCGFLGWAHLTRPTRAQPAAAAPRPVTA